MSDHLQDAILEAEINLAALRLQAAKTPQERRGLWDELQQLVKQRSHTQIERMERAKGLARRA